MISPAISSRRHRAAIAAVLTMIVAISFAAASFYVGWFPGYDVGIFGGPLVLALLLYRSVKARILAWLLLTCLAVLSVIATIVGLWFLGP